MKKLLIGLTGGIGSGKSTIAQAFQERGIVTIDADETAREMVEPGKPALQAVIKRFGETIVKTDGTLKRNKLSEIIFQHPDERDWLNALLHPLIKERMLKQADLAAGPYVILCVPLLLESGWEAMFDRILVIDIDEITQCQRACSRDKKTSEQIKKIMASQLSRSARLEAADDKIDNHGTIFDVKKQINYFHQLYTKMAYEQC